MHAVFAGSSGDESICVVADDSDIYLSLLHISPEVNAQLYFRQGKAKDKNGIEYHDVHSLARYLGTEICSILLAFHVLTGSDFTNPFYGRTKVTAFKKLQQKKVYCSKLESLGSESVNFDEIVDFILHIIYNRPLKEKTPGESRHSMLLTAKKTKNGKKYPSSRAIVPDVKSLKMKILRANFITNCMINCCNNNYVPLDPAEYGWEWNPSDLNWQPIWYEGNALPECADMNIEGEEEDTVLDAADDTQNSEDELDDEDNESDYVPSDADSSDDSDLDSD